MKLLIAYDGSQCADAVLDALTHAGLPTRGEALVMSTTGAVARAQYSVEIIRASRRKRKTNGN